MRGIPPLSSGVHNIATGLIFLAGFMVMGFVLIYLRDFAPGAEEWAASYGEGTHFETRLAHVHGALFALVNVAVGLLLPRMPGTERQRSLVAGFAIAGMLMPLGILAEVLVGLPPILVIIGGVSILTGMSLAAVIWFRSVYFAAPGSAASDADASGVR
jgi:hypothetical protein